MNKAVTNKVSYDWFYFYFVWYVVDWTNHILPDIEQSEAVYFYSLWVASAERGRRAPHATDVEPACQAWLERWLRFFGPMDGPPTLTRIIRARRRSQYGRGGALSFICRHHSSVATAIAMHSATAMLNFNGFNSSRLQYQAQATRHGSTKSAPSHGISAAPRCHSARRRAGTGGGRGGVKINPIQSHSFFMERSISERGCLGVAGHPSCQLERNRELGIEFHMRAAARRFIRREGTPVVAVLDGHLFPVRFFVSVGSFPSATALFLTPFFVLFSLHIVLDGNELCSECCPL